jgi:pimeloyl-ACP methyl ester carboxylesterase
VVWGDRDPFFAVAVGERLARAIPGAAFDVIRQCGHFVPLERPNALVQVIGRQLHAPAPVRLAR